MHFHLVHIETVTCVYTYNNNIWCTFDDSTALRVYTVEQQQYEEEYIKKFNRKNSYITYITFK